MVEAQDAQGLRGDSGTTTVLIRLEDINDNFPIFTQSEPLPWDLGRAGGRGQGAGCSRRGDLGPDPSPHPKVGLGLREVTWAKRGALLPIPAHIPKAVLLPPDSEH